MNKNVSIDSFKDIRGWIKSLLSVLTFFVFFSLMLMPVSWADTEVDAVEYVYEFDTPEQQSLFEYLIAELRCPKCQNQNLMDSNADISKYMKNKIHEMILQGKSKEQVVNALRARYGDFITYKPPFNFQTAILWLLPVLLLCFALIIVILRSSIFSKTINYEQTISDNTKSSHDEDFSSWLKKNKKDY